MVIILRSVTVPTPALSGSGSWVWSQPLFGTPFDFFANVIILRFSNVSSWGSRRILSYWGPRSMRLSKYETLEVRSEQVSESENSFPLSAISSPSPQDQPSRRMPPLSGLDWNIFFYLMICNFLLRFILMIWEWPYCKKSQVNKKLKWIQHDVKNMKVHKLLNWSRGCLKSRLVSGWAERRPSSRNLSNSAEYTFRVPQCDSSATDFWLLRQPPKH